MLTLYHAPASRSTAIKQLILELGIEDQIQVIKVDIPRQDGSGARDPANAHPEGKVPYLTDGEDFIRERAAIVAYLTDRFPKAGLGPKVGDPKRGRYLTWLAWYQGVLEPVAIFKMLGLSHPGLDATFRDYQVAMDWLDQTLSLSPYLLGEDYSAADLLCASPFGWFGDEMPRPQSVSDWVARCQDRAAYRAADRDD